MSIQNKPNLTPAAAPAPTEAAGAADEYHMAAFKEALALEGIVSKRADVAKAPAPVSDDGNEEFASAAPAKPAAPAEKPAVKEAPLDKSFSKLASEKAALRKQQESLKPYEEAAKVIRPEQMQALAKAMASGQPLSMLAALGINYTDVAKAMVGQEGKKVTPPADADKETSDDPVMNHPVVKQLQAQLQELQGDRVSRARTEVVGTIKGYLDGANERFPHLAAIDGSADKVLKFLEKHVHETGSQPGETPEESIEIAAAEVEKAEAKEAVRWAKVLSDLQAKSGRVKSVDSSAPESPTSRESSGQKTLTNSMTAPAATAHEPEDKDALYQSILDDKSLWAD